MRIKNFVFHLLEVEEKEDLAGKIFNVGLFLLICLNVLAVIVESVQEVSIQYGSIFRIFEIFSVVLFSIEYVLRVWTCNENPRFELGFRGKLHYLFTPMAIIDLISILPFYLPLIIPFDLRFLRALRLIRLIRVFKLTRFNDALLTIIRVIKSKSHELAITVFAVILLLVIFSSLVFLAENDVQPKAFSSIPAAMWWGVVTLTTVGYGDIYPVTPIGKILGAMISLLGIGLFALPAGILGSGFVEEIQRRKKGDAICPHCGKNISSDRDLHEK